MSDRWEVHYYAFGTTPGVDLLEQEILERASDSDRVERGDITDDTGQYRQIGQFLYVTAESPDEARRVAAEWLDKTVRTFSHWRSQCGLDRDDEFDTFVFFEVGEPQPRVND